MKYKYACENCGYYSLIKEEEVVFEYKCKNCGEVVKLEEHPEVQTDDVSLVTEKTAIAQMKNELEQLGHQRLWEIVESVPTVTVRLKYRNYFIKAGGHVPEGENIFVEDMQGKFYLK